MKITFIITGAGTSVILAGFAASCGPSTSNPDGGAFDASYEAPAPEPLQTATITATVGSTRFVTREHFLASAEMQVTGEPYAEIMGRDLTGYSRDNPTPNIYTDPSPTAQGPWIDLNGFSTAVESYEYSKQPMNNVAFESGAGTSLLYAPLVNPDGVGGPQASALLADL